MKDRGMNKPSRLMQILKIETDFLRHRQKITHVQNRNALQEIRRAHNSQMQSINSFRKKWGQSATYKQREHQRAISYENKLIHSSLAKQYNRKNKAQSAQKLNETIRSNNSSRISLASSASKRKGIKQQNKRLRDKIVSIESTLSKNTMDRQYQTMNNTRRRLQVYSAKNRERMNISLKKMNVEPKVLPYKKKRK